MFNSRNNQVDNNTSNTIKTNLRHMAFAMGEMGQSEIDGSRDNPRIVEYFDATTLNATDDEVPWCAAFANFVLKSSGIAGTNSAMALSFKYWGRETKKPAYGDLVLFSHGNGRGHVGFYVGTSKGRVSVLGGNQNDSVNITQFDARTVYMYRTPLTGWRSTTIMAASAGGVVSAGAAIAGASKLATGGAVSTAIVAAQGVTPSQSIVVDGINAAMPYLSPDMQGLASGILGLMSFAYVIYKRLKIIATVQQ